MQLKADDIGAVVGSFGVAVGGGGGVKASG